MPRLKVKNFQTFGDGLLKIYEMKDRKKGRHLANVRFGDRTVGAKRFMDAKVLSEQIDRTVAVPLVGISQMNLIEIGDKQYKIFQVQEKFDNKPPCSYLHLQESKVRINENR